MTYDGAALYNLEELMYCRNNKCDTINWEDGPTLVDTERPTDCLTDEPSARRGTGHRYRRVKSSSGAARILSPQGNVWQLP